MKYVVIYTSNGRKRASNPLQHHEALARQKWLAEHKNIVSTVEPA